MFSSQKVLTNLQNEKNDFLIFGFIMKDMKKNQI